ncbi:MAG TPA: HNH endonuclease signature motif containing protein [Solirubrobacterales bacterium]|nr:HNH endonuclease signature motif containing protein [Solirubrobacterales bacterium]
MKRPCIGCGRLILKGSYCPRCDPSRKRRRVTPGRGSGGAAARFRREVLARAGGRCERCGSTEDVEAHHRRALTDGGSNDPSNGEALCRRCHRPADRQQRERRKQRRTAQGNLKQRRRRGR